MTEPYINGTVGLEELCLVAGAKTALTTPLGVRRGIRRRISTGRYTPQHISAKYPWCGRPTARVPALRSVAYARHERVGSRWSIGWAGSRRSRRWQGRPSRFGGQYVPSGGRCVVWRVWSKLAII